MIKSEVHLTEQNGVIIYHYLEVDCFRIIIIIKIAFIIIHK